ncbi:hypothetical protein L9F63_021401, partial [Diploptera punctata]
NFISPLKLPKPDTSRGFLYTYTPMRNYEMSCSAKCLLKVCEFPWIAGGSLKLKVSTNTRGVARAPCVFAARKCIRTFSLTVKGQV